MTLATSLASLSALVVVKLALILTTRDYFTRCYIAQGALDVAVLYVILRPFSGRECTARAAFVLAAIFETAKAFDVLTGLDIARAFVWTVMLGTQFDILAFPVYALAVTLLCAMDRGPEHSHL